MSTYPQARFMLSAASIQQFPAGCRQEVAVAGRSNAGKSSAINSITHRTNLARSGKTPGLTQLVNFFELQQDQRLVDLPGYGFAKVPPKVQAHWHQLVGEYFATRNSLSGLLLIVDVRRGLKDGDRALLEWTVRRELPVHVLLTKSDKLTRNEARKELARSQSELGAGRLRAALFIPEQGRGRASPKRAAKSSGEIKNPVDRGAEPPGQTNPAWG